MQVKQQFDVDIVSLVCRFIKTETPVQVFSCEFCKAFKNTNFAEKQQSSVSNDIIIARVFCKL